MRRQLMFLAIVSSLLWTGCEGSDAEELEPEAELLGQVGTARDAGKASVDAGTKGSAASPGSSGLGGACTANTDCSGAGARCLTDLLSFTIPGGLCTLSCKNDRQCGTTGACPFAAMVDLAKKFMPDAGITDSMSICMPKCTSGTDCRSGYSCAALPTLPLMPAASPGAKFCMPPVPDGGLPRPDGGFPGLPGSKT